MGGPPGARAYRGRECRGLPLPRDRSIRRFLGPEGPVAPKSWFAALIYCRRDRIALSVPLNGLLGRAHDIGSVRYLINAN